MVVSGYNGILEGNVVEDLENWMAFKLLISVKNFLMKGSPQVGAVRGKVSPCTTIVTLKSMLIFL